MLANVEFEGKRPIRSGYVLTYRDFGMDDNNHTSDRRISATQAADRGQYIVTVEADSDAESQRALEVMKRFHPIDISAGDGISDGVVGGTSTAYAADTSTTALLPNGSVITAPFPLTLRFSDGKWVNNDFDYSNFIVFVPTH